MCILINILLNLLIVKSLIIEIQSRSLGIERIISIRIKQQLRQEGLKNMAKVKEGTPGLIKDI